MKYIKEAMNRHTKRGFSLIELVTAISIICIIMASVLYVYFSFSKEYNDASAINQKEFYTEEAVRYLENELVKGNGSITVADNVIAITRSKDKTEAENIDYIKKQSDELVIEYTENGQHKATNVFLRDVSNFTVSRSGDIILIDIDSQEGIRIRKCINTKNIE